MYLNSKKLKCHYFADFFTNTNGKNVPYYHGYIPGIIVSAVYSDSVAKAGKCSVQLLCQNKLVTQQSVRISKAWIHLRKGDGRADSVIQRMGRSPAY